MINFINSKNVSLNNKEPYLVFFHGFLGQPSMWNEVISYLQNHNFSQFSTAVLPGHGKNFTKLKKRNYDFNSLVDDAMSKIVETKKIWLIGYSMGARYALGLMCRHSHLFEGAIFLSVNPGIEDKKEKQQRRQWDLKQAKMIEERGLDVFVSKFEKSLIFSSQKKLSIDKLNIQKIARTSHTNQGASFAMKNLGLGHMPCYINELANLNKPICIITGQLDKKFERSANKINQDCDNVFHEIIDEAGHNPVLEQSARVCKIVKNYILTNS